ncbi:hypothetical protein [Planifilum fimeticola]
MKKVLLIFTAFLLAFMTVPAAYADSMVKLDAVNGLVSLSANPDVKIPVKVTLSDSKVKGQKLLKINMNGGVGLKAIANAKVMVNGHDISADNIDKARSKLTVALDEKMLRVGNTNKVVVQLGLNVAKIDLVKLQLCLNLTSDVILQAQQGEVSVELSGCKDGDNGPGGDDNNDDSNNGGDDGGKDGSKGDDDGDKGNDNGGKGSDNDGSKGGTLPNHNSGGQLPKTATPYPTLALIGSLLLLAGAGLFRLNARKG